MYGILQEENIFILTGVLIMLAFALAFVLFFNYSQKKILKEQVRIQQLNFKHQEDLLYSTILAQEAERKRIARDLHDEIGSKLNVIFLNIHRLKEMGKEHEGIGRITEEVEAVINRTINSTRLISHELLPPTLEEFGLAEAIRELQHSFNQLGSIRIEFTSEKNKGLIENKLVELNLFRVIQELINNSTRHGKATGIDIKLCLDDEMLELIYKDNGIGFDITNVEEKKGLGMKNIESRLRIIKAVYTFRSSLEEGTSVAIQIPSNELIKK